MTWYRRTSDSPLGPLHLVASDHGLVEMLFAGQRDEASRFDAIEVARHPILDLAERELGAYFAGLSKRFTVPLAPDGTDFQLAVWRALCAVPYGTTCAYRDIARTLGQPGAERAVGAANGRNRIGIIVPCHRVIGADGGLTGYAAGIDKKRWLLAHEGAELGLGLAHDR